MSSIHLTPAERNALLDHYRRSPDPAVGHRAHVLLLLDAGHSGATIAAVLFCSVGTISRWSARFKAEGVDAVFGRPRGRRRSGGPRLGGGGGPVGADALAHSFRFILTEGRKKEGRGAALFCRHLDDLRRAFRHYKVIHVLCDNAGTHTAKGSKLVRAYLKEWGRRVRVHYLPKYSPDTNPVERVWWRLHEAVTRNHRCQTMGELLDLTFDWFETHTHFRVQSSVYTKCPGK